jgi:hypothetical protein
VLDEITDHERWVGYANHPAKWRAILEQVVADTTGADRRPPGRDDERGRRRGVPRPTRRPGAAPTRSKSISG